MRELLESAREEIVRLRRERELLRARVEMIDLFALVLRIRVEPPRSAQGEDVAWLLKREVEIIDQAKWDAEQATEEAERRDGDE